MSAVDLVLALVLALWGCAAATLLLVYRAEFRRAWREPTLRSPVLIVESDDWGPGPEEDAAWLARITEVLTRYRDCRGRQPVMTIGVVLAYPGLPSGGSASPANLTLADDRFRRIRATLVDGVQARVFDLQLHGMEHYWRPTMMTVARRDPDVAGWLQRQGVPRTEELPSHLQTRWADTSTLPSIPLTPDEIKRAVREELTTFARVFGTVPPVAVPPTFVWNAVVEREWAAGGVRYVVTPGRRYVGRDESGRPIADRAEIYSGERSDSGLVYLVRDRYFEPALGHDAGRGLEALAAKTRAGRATLLETHRLNFIGDAASGARSVAELERVIASALRLFPDLRFLSTQELGDKLAVRDADLVETRLIPRLAAGLVRLAETPGLRKLAWLTGLAMPAALFLLIARPAVRVPLTQSRSTRLAT